MTEKKKDKIYVWINGCKFEKVEKKIECLKPVTDENILDGKLRFIDTLKYLIRIMPQDDSSFETLVSLTSYLINNDGNVSGKNQADLIMHFINYWKKLGVLDV